MSIIGEKGFFPFWGVRARRAACLVLTFTPNGSGAVTVTNKQKQRGLASVSRTDTGAFTLTLDSKYAALLSYSAGVRSPSGQYTAQIVGTPSLGASTGATIPIQIYQASSAADITADAAAEVSVTLFLSKSSLEAEK